MEYGVVVTSQMEWNVYNKRLKDGLYDRFSDIAMVAFIDIRSGEIRFRDIFPFELERLTPAPDNGKAYKKLLLAAQSWVQGKNTWEDFCAVRERKLRERKAFPWEEPPQLKYMSLKNGRFMAEIDAMLKKSEREIKRNVTLTRRECRWRNTGGDGKKNGDIKKLRQQQLIE